MPLPTILVKDGANIDRTVFRIDSGRQAAADSSAVVLSAEDLAAINAIATALAGIATAANQSTGNSTLSSILTALGPAATAALQTAGNTLLSDILARLNDPLGVTQDGAFDVNITNEAVQATFDAYTYPGYKQGQNVPVLDGTASFTFVPASGTSTGSAIDALAANANRKAFQFQNASDTDFTVNFDGTASASAGFLVAPGKFLEFYGAACPKGAVSIFCGASAKRYVLRTA